MKEKRGFSIGTSSLNPGSNSCGAFVITIKSPTSGTSQAVNTVNAGGAHATALVSSPTKVNPSTGTANPYSSAPPPGFSESPSETGNNSRPGSGNTVKGLISNTNKLTASGTKVPPYPAKPNEEWMRKALIRIKPVQKKPFLNNNITVFLFKKILKKAFFSEFFSKIF